MSGDPSNFYAGIGARKTPKAIQEVMRKLALKLGQRGFILRSGGAEGADQAFALGHDYPKEIFLPWRGFENMTGTVVTGEPARKAAAMVARIQPLWPTFSDGSRKLHTRNVFQVFGADLKTPVKFVLCWTKDASNGSDRPCDSKTGGTGTAIRLAASAKIPVYNLAHPDDYTKALSWIENKPEN